MGPDGEGSVRRQALAQARRMGHGSLSDEERPMRFDEYRKHDAVGLAELVARREVTPGELLDAALARTAEVNPQINAVTEDLSEFGRVAATAPPDGPLAGVPYLLKDLGASLAGTPTTRGSKMFAKTV